MRFTPYFIFFIFFVSCHTKREEAKPSSETKSPILNTKTPSSSKEDVLKVLNKKVTETKAFINKHSSYNSKIAFLVDMRIPSNNYRFFVVDLQNDTVINKGLVAHGINSKKNEKGEMIFSNEENSNCTSLGIYLVGESYIGRFGKSYRLYGLEKTNSNAITRSIILHKYASVPDNIEPPYPIHNSLGCPMVSPLFFNHLEEIIDKSKEKIILSIYY